MGQNTPVVALKIAEIDPPRWVEQTSGWVEIFSGWVENLSTQIFRVAFAFFVAGDVTV